MAANNKQLELNKIQKEQRIGLKGINRQGSIMQIIDYKATRNIIVQFLDKYGYVKQTTWDNFKKGSVDNPYAPTVYGYGIVGDIKNYCFSKEYQTWSSMIERCYSEKYKIKYPTYKDVKCCEEWLYFPNFYEWLHSQENFDKWLNGKRWCLDKDILIKGNKIYSPDTCCLVPEQVNTLFVKKDANRGDLPIGVFRKSGRYSAKIVYGKCNNKAKSTSYSYPTPEDAFYLGYKPTKERHIKRIAQEQFDEGNITKRCYEAMMNYEVEITD